MVNEHYEPVQPTTKRSYSDRCESYRTIEPPNRRIFRAATKLCFENGRDSTRGVPHLAHRNRSFREGNAKRFSTFAFFFFSPPPPPPSPLARVSIHERACTIIIVEPWTDSFDGNHFGNLRRDSRSSFFEFVPLRGHDLRDYYRYKT